VAGNVVRILITTDSAQAQAGLAKVKAEGMSLGSVMKLAGAGMVVGLGVATVATLKMASEFQGSMERIHTQAGVAQDQIKGLGDGVLKLAGQVGQDPNSLAEALYHIESSFASTGISGEHALNLLKVAAEGATVGHANLVDVTNALDAAVVSGIPGVENLTSAMGTLNATVGAGDMNMQDLANAFSTGLLASVKSFGLSITDVGAALAVFGDNNVRGQTAATQLRMAVQSLAEPAKGGAAALAKLGLQSDSLAKDMQSGGLNAALGDLITHMNAAGISADQQGQIITDAFGKRAGQGINVLVGQYDRLQSKYTDLAKGATGFQDAWTATTHTLQFQLSAFVDGAKAAGISLGTALLPAVSDLLTVLKLGFPIVQGLAQVFTAIPAPVRDAALALGVFALAAKLLGPALAQVGAKVKETGASLAGWGKGITSAEGITGKFKAGLGGVVGALGGPWGIAITAGTTLLGLWAAHQQEANQRTQDFRSALEASGGAIDDTTKKLAAQQLQESGALDAAKQLGINLGDLTQAALGNRDAWTKVNDVLSQHKDIQTSVHGAMSQSQQQAGRLAVAADKVRAAIGDESGSLADAKSKQQDLTAAQGEGTTSSGTLADANAKLSQALNDLSDALDSSKNAMLGAMGAEDAYYASVDAATKAVKDNGSGLDVHTEKGRANRKALEDLVKTGLDYVKGLKDQGASQDQVDAGLRMVEGNFVKTAKQMGLTTAQAKALAAQFFGDADAASSAANDASAYARALKAIPSTVTTRIIVNGASQLAQVSSSSANVRENRTPVQGSGGVPHAAVGGPRGSRTLVGEYGPELVDLPYGSMVRSNPDTQRLMSGGGAGSESEVVVRFLGDTEIARAFVELIRRTVRVSGTRDVQLLFGGALS